MFASSTKKELKFGEGFITIRKLSGYQLDLARDEAQARNVSHLRRLGGELLTAMNSSQMNEAAQQLKEKRNTEKAAPNPAAKYADYDRQTTLRQGIVNWSEGEVDAAKLQDLEESVAQETFEAIIDLTVPSKVQAEATTEKD